MGNRYVISVWEYNTYKHDFVYNEFWRGESFFKALFKLHAAKAAGFGCVKLEWR